MAFAYFFLLLLQPASSYTCASGEYFTKEPFKVCTGTCDSTQCCAEAQECSAYFGTGGSLVACTGGKEVRTSLENGYCEAASCGTSDEEHCCKKPKCTELTDDCPTGERKIPEEVGLTLGECCEPFATCESAFADEYEDLLKPHKFQCGDSKKVNPSGSCLGDICEETDKDSCCASSDKCNDFSSCTVGGETKKVSSWGADEGACCRDASTSEDCTSKFVSKGGDTAGGTKMECPLQRPNLQTAKCDTASCEHRDAYTCCAAAEVCMATYTEPTTTTTTTKTTGQGALAGQAKSSYSIAFVPLYAVIGATVVL